MTSGQSDTARVDAEASRWVAEYNGVDAAQIIDPAFLSWLAADGRHRYAYDLAALGWQRAAALRPGETIDELVADVRRPIISPMRVALGAGALMAACAAAFVVLGVMDAPDARYATVIAEVRPVPLEDGSSVTLGADSRIEVRFTANERRVSLGAGEAFFEVAHDDSRPFIVEAGETHVRVVGTKFEVRRVPDSVVVAVLEGEVRVRRGGDQAAILAEGQALLPGQRVAMRARDFPLLPAPAPSPVQTTGSLIAGAWRDGHLGYDNARLADVVADLNRYHAPGIRLASREVGELRITAAFRAEDIPRFLRALPDTLPVEVSETGQARFELSARGSD